MAKKVRSTERARERRVAERARERREADARRRAAMFWMLREAGASYAEMGRAVDLSIERVRQICRGYGKESAGYLVLVRNRVPADVHARVLGTSGSDPTPERNIHPHPRHEIDHPALRHRVTPRGRIADVLPVRDQGGDATL